MNENYPFKIGEVIPTYIEDDRGGVGITICGIDFGDNRLLVEITDASDFWAKDKGEGYLFSKGMKIGDKLILTPLYAHPTDSQQSISCKTLMIRCWVIKEAQYPWFSLDITETGEKQFAHYK